MSGFIYRAPEKGDYHSQGRIRLAGTPLMPGGQWDDFLPPNDFQDRGFPTMACATFGTIHAVRILAKKFFTDDTDWSRRFLAKISGTTLQGNDPHTVAETLRYKGTVPEAEWPYSSNIDSFGAFYADIPFSLYTDAQVLFRGKYNFGHQYVGTDAKSMMARLEYSPLGADVYAWNVPDANGVYHREKKKSGHWVLIYGYVQGQYWKCFDTYDETHKKLAWDFGFTMVKEYTLNKEVLTINPLDPTYLWATAIRWFKKIMNIA